MSVLRTSETLSFFNNTKKPELRNWGIQGSLKIMSTLIEEII